MSNVSILLQDGTEICFNTNLTARELFDLVEVQYLHNNPFFTIVHYSCDQESIAIRFDQIVMISVS